MNHRTKTSLTGLVSLTALVLLGCATGESECTDGIDNDLNGFTDCDDPACATRGECTTPDGGPDACGPANCAGCCDSDRCVSGDSLAACGLGGLACEACVIGATCEANACVGGPPACAPSNCDGCCMGETCVAGDQDTACGDGGEACGACEAWEVCGGGICGVDPASVWRISLLDATLPATNLDDEDWDGIGAGEADPFVELRVGDAGTAAITMPTIEDTTTPDWTMGGTTTTLSPDLSAADILAFLRFDMFEEDLRFNDTVGMCRFRDAATAFNGEVITLVCDPDPTRGHAGFTLRWQLVPG